MKPTKITKLDRQDSYGNTTYVIEFATGEKAFYTSKDADQKKFVVGSDTECTLEKKVGKNNVEYFKVVLPQKQFTPGGGGKPTVDPRAQMAGFAASYTKDLIIAGKIGMQDFGVTFEMIYGEMISKLP